MENEERNPHFCPIYEELRESFHLKKEYCDNAPKCPKTPEECSALADLKAEVEGSVAITTDEELQQEKLIREWMEKEGIDPTLLS